MQTAVHRALEVLSVRDAAEAGRIRSRLQEHPDEAEPLCELAGTLFARGQADAASSVYMEALKLEAGCVIAHKGLGLILEGGGYLDDAVLCYRTAVQLQPTSEHHYLLGRSLHQGGMLGEAAQHYDLALQLDPSNVDARYNIGVLLAAAGRLADAMAAFREITEQRPTAGRAWTSLGALLAGQGQGEEAVACLERAAQLRPDDALTLANLADALRASDRIDKARERAQQALLVEADNAVAGSVLARIDLQEGDIVAARDRLLSLLDGEIPARLRGRMLVDLGMAHDRLQESELAFSASTKGAQELASQPPADGIDFAAYPAQVATLAEWTPNALQQVHMAADGDGGEGSTASPIFLVGFPRSGTTLTEQILCAHPQLRSLDERPLLDRLIAAASGLLEGAVPYPQCIDQLRPAQLAVLRRQYWQMVAEEEAEAGASRVVDKMPLNLVHLGFIARLFPAAPVLVALRDPRDCCISAFMQDFVANEAMVQFLDLGSTTALYSQVMGLWTSCREKLGNPWLETRYEDLVDDLEGTARRMLDFLALPWDPAVLNYHQQAARKHISTPSHKDVTRPIFRRALRRWERYSTQFEPFQPRLQPFVEAFGYEP